MQLTKAEEQLILFLRGIGEVKTLEEIEQRVEELKKEFDELRRYKTFMVNHPTHEIAIKSYSEEKGTSFKTNISKANMKKIATFLMDENLAEQKAANEAIEKYRGVFNGK